MVLSTNSAMRDAATAFAAHQRAVVEAGPIGGDDPRRDLFHLWDRNGIWMRTEPVAAQHLLDHEVVGGPSAAVNDPAVLAVVEALVDVGALAAQDGSVHWHATMTLLTMHRVWRRQSYPDDYRRRSQERLGQLLSVIPPRLGGVPGSLPPRRIALEAFARWTEDVHALCDSGVLADRPLHRCIWVVDQWFVRHRADPTRARAYLEDLRHVSVAAPTRPVHVRLIGIFQDAVDAGSAPAGLDGEEVYALVNAAVRHLLGSWLVGGFPDDARRRIAMVVGRALAAPPATVDACLAVAVATGDPTRTGPAT